MNPRCTALGWSTFLWRFVLGLDELARICWSLGCQAAGLGAKAYRLKLASTRYQQQGKILSLNREMAYSEIFGMENKWPSIYTFSKIALFGNAVAEQQLARQWYASPFQIPVRQAWVMSETLSYMTRIEEWRRWFPGWWLSFPFFTSAWELTSSTFNVSYSAAKPVT